ncbi:MAG: YesL family protein [Sphaerochaetaceae bacterium]|nr:YesL family protein [Spirochaetales bacterium]MDY5500604.1 YesL family protein [Sphaerochaetaceae bacterium]
MDWQGMFDPENSFWNFWGKVFDVCLLAILWLVCSLPILTCGAATVSLLSYTLKQADDTEGYAVRSFFREFARSFFPSTLLWLATILVGGILYGNLYAVGRIAVPMFVRLPLYSLALCLVVLFACEVVWAYALLASFRIGVGKAVRDALAMAARYPIRTLLAIASLAGAVLATWWLPVLFSVWFALSLFLQSMLLRGAVLELRSSV